MMADHASRIVRKARDRRLLDVAAVGTAAAAAWRMRRDLRRARGTAPLCAPATAIDVRVRPIASSQMSPRAPLRLAALGDSSIVGVGSLRIADCLAVQIARRVADATGRTVHVRGHGVSGARTWDVTTSQVAALATGPRPDVVVVVVGANDIVHMTPPWRYRRAVSTLYRALREREDAPVIACSLPEVRAVTIVGHPLRDAAVAYGRLLGVLQRRAVRDLTGVTFVDARRIAGPAFLRRPEAMSSDGFHPSGVGYALLADALAPAVRDAATARPRDVRADDGGPPALSASRSSRTLAAPGPMPTSARG